MAGQRLGPPEVCLELADQSVREFSTSDFFGLSARDQASQAARLTDQFVDQNRAILAAMDSRADSVFDGREVRLRISSGAAVGATPLLSPTTARPDYGLVIQPRFPWRGIGQMLAETGWRVLPVPLRLPLMRRSERRVPAWVLSAMLIRRFEALFRQISRRFDLVEALCAAPRGRVLWQPYAAERLPRAQALSVPCAFPDLNQDRMLKSAIRHAVEKQRRSLQGQVRHGAFVTSLIHRCEAMLAKLQDVPPMLPTPRFLQGWLSRPLRAVSLAEGIQAIQWITEDRGLAGISDLEGLPWRMSMSEFFEAYVEMVLETIARRHGGVLRIGRRRQTVHPIQWSPPFSGSQSALIPDLWIEWPGLTVLVDAKYKRHWQEWRWTAGAQLSAEERERHRTDLLQILAYANLPRADRVVACLVYPCALEIWTQLVEAGCAVRTAEVGTGGRPLSVWLTALPMEATAHRAAEPIEGAVRAILANPQQSRSA